MAKKAVVLMMCLIGFIYAQEWVSFDPTKPEGTPLKIEVLSSDLTETKIKISVYGMWKKDTLIDGITFQRISLPGVLVNTPVIGRPELPGVVELFCLPPTSGAEFYIGNYTDTLLSDYMVFPTQKSVLESEPPPPFYMDTLFYSTDIFYPETLTIEGEPGIMRNIRVINGLLHPMQFNPEKQKLRVYTNMVITLKYEGTDPRNPLDGYPSKYFPQWEDEMYREVRGYTGVVPSPPRWWGGVTGKICWPPPPQWVDLGREGYLIIAAADYFNGNSAELTEFIHWKQKKGYIAGMVNLHSIVGDYDANDTCELAGFIHQCYDDPTLYASDIPPTVDPEDVYLSYVLLIGDAPPCYEEQIGSSSHIPTFYVEATATGEYPPRDPHSLFTDNWYAGCRGLLEYLDVAIGRWCPRNTQDVNTFLNKTYAYERTPPSSWNGRRVLSVAWDNPNVPPEQYTTAYRECKEHIRTLYLDPYYYNVVTAYGQIARNSNVINAISNNGGLVGLNYRGHGNLLSWWNWNTANEYFFREDIYNLTNAPRFPLVYNVCCYNGRILPTIAEGILVDEVPVEAWIRNPDGGAAGALGASTESERTWNNRLDTLLWRYLTETGWNTGWVITHVKNRIFAAANALQREDPDLAQMGIDVARMYYWIGDPNLCQWNRTPSTPVVTHPTSIPCGQDVEFEVTVSNPWGGPVLEAMVCLYKPGDVHLVGIAYLGHISFIVHCDNPGELYVTVTRYKALPDSLPDLTIRPYEGTCDVEEEGPIASISSSKPSFKWNLSQVSSNPTSDIAHISYSIAEPTYANLKIYDASGRMARTLVAEKKEPGDYKTIWDGKDNNGRELSAGVYFYRLEAEGFTATKRLVLIR